MTENPECFGNGFWEAGTPRRVQVEHNAIKRWTNCGLRILYEWVLRFLLSELGIDF
jgi:hypothetical protein